MNTPKKRTWVLLIGLFLVISACLFILVRLLFVLDTSNKKDQLRRVTVGTASLLAETADSPEEQAKGLSNRTFIPDNTGMLFLFPVKQARVFWMKDTLIPLDIIWVTNNRVAGIDRMPAEPGVLETDLKRYFSPGPVDAAIEANFGWSEKNSIKIGDPVRY